MTAKTEHPPFFGRRVNRVQLAELFGVHVTTIDNWVRRGCPCLKRGGKGKPSEFDTADVHAWIVETSVAEAVGTDDQVGFDEALRRKELANAKLKELEYAQRSGAVVSTEDALRHFADMISNARAKLLGVPHKLAPLVAIEKSRPKCREMIEREITEALTDLAWNFGGVGDDAGRARKPRARDRKDRRKMGAAAKTDRKRVGRSVSKAKPRK